MKNNLLIIAVLVSICCISALNVKTNDSFEPVAVIELFSSQGCSSCPKADALLSKTISNKGTKNIYALSFHVDYWNRLGWNDPFSNSKFSARQNTYSDKMNLNSNYTPQAIVNGSTEFVGSDEAKLNKSISEALTIRSKASFEDIALSFNEKNIPEIHYTLKGNFDLCKINFALISLKETTVIKRGENAGITLVNENVVRQLVTVDAASKGSVTFEKTPLPAKNNMAVIAYVQDKISFKIVGATRVSP